MSGQTWTPAPKRGVIPLHPMTFGMLLGRAFSALRHNPKVLFGFAVTVQFAITAITVVVLVMVAGFAAVRIASVPPGSADQGPIVAGTVALGVLVAIVLSLATVAFTSIVQGLVAADVSFAALGRRAPLRALWARVRPAFWRLFAFALLQGLAVFVWLLAVGGVAFLIMSGADFDAAAIGIAVLLIVLLFLASIPLVVWLSTKLLVVPSVLVLEGAGLLEAMVRSWRLIRGRFWPALGVMFLIGAIMGIAAQVVSIPGSIITTLLTGTLAPTGSPEPSEMIGFLAATILPQILVLAVQAITLVVQGTGATLIYLDSRMRYEGLDQTLIRHVERSALGAADAELGDPYVVDPARAVSKSPPPAQSTPPAYGPGQPPFAGHAPAPGHPPAPGYHAAAGYPPVPGRPPASGYPPAPAYPPASAPTGPASGEGLAPPPPPIAPPPTPTAQGEDPPGGWAAPGGHG